MRSSALNTPLDFCTKAMHSMVHEHSFPVTGQIWTFKRMTALGHEHE